MKYIHISIYYTILFLYRRSVVVLHLDSELWWQSSKDELIHWDQISLRRSEELSMDPAALVETRCLLLKLKRLINCWSILRTIALFFCWGGELLERHGKFCVRMLVSGTFLGLLGLKTSGLNVNRGQFTSRFCNDRKHSCPDQRSLCKAHGDSRKTYRVLTSSSSPLEAELERTWEGNLENAGWCCSPGVILDRTWQLRGIPDIPCKNWQFRNRHFWMT